MRRSKTLARIHHGEVARVCSLGSYIPSYIAHAAGAGYDCVWLDLEHRSIDAREVEALLVQCHLHDVDCLVRPATRQQTQLYRYLEDGASGLMIPHVGSAEEARQLVSAVKFPPIGDRGLDNAGLDSGYLANPDHLAYSQAANRETFLVVQIESPTAVENCEEIVSVEGVDAVFVGTGDLGFRLALVGDAEGSRLEAAIARIAAACAKHGIAWGCPTGSSEVLRRRKTQGAQLLCNFGEYIHLMTGLQDSIKEFDAGCSD